MTAVRYNFADCTLDIGRHTLSRAGQAVPVEPMVFDLLRLLVETRDTLISRERMIQAIWDGRIVSDSAISACIAAARRAVGDDGKAQAIIRTVPRRGIQCVAEVQRLTDAPPDPDRQLSPRIRFTRNRDGKALAYAVSGSGPPVLFLSFPGTDLEADWASPFFRPLFDALGARNTLLRFDPLGTGQSDLRTVSADPAATAQDMLSVLDAAGVRRVHLFCQSGTSLAAVHFAAAYPDRVGRMVLNGGFAEGRNRRADDGAAEQVHAMISEGWARPGSSFLLAYALLFFPEGPLDLARDVVEIMQRSCPAENMLRMREATNKASVRDLLPAVRCPTMIVHARRDSMHPLSQARILAAGIERSELLILESANHVPMPGSADWPGFVDAVCGFLNDAGLDQG